MEYMNLQTGFRVPLDDITDKEKKFYEKALDAFMKNMDYLKFDYFVFEVISVLYDEKISHLEVRKHPLYLAIKDMWLQLGVQQGKVARSTKKITPDLPPQ